MTLTKTQSFPASIHGTTVVSFIQMTLTNTQSFPAGSHGTAALSFIHKKIKKILTDYAAYCTLKSCLCFCFSEPGHVVLPVDAMRVEVIVLIVLSTFVNTVVLHCASNYLFTFYITLSIECLGRNRA